ncbi:hypothetical protein M6B38_366100 [Iris pallida]|uniref:Uncharacterized protein n=1 Tax=Iris pallida TaxID=29817 RepID=A0AAX6GGM5_IRIPA|nr:hypothetical protein M6B38_366100 [Iris pallida]
MRRSIPTHSHFWSLLVPFPAGVLSPADTLSSAERHPPLSHSPTSPDLMSELLWFSFRG